MSKKSQSSGGFTIVELLIVIVVIGILAAITIVAYNGVQQRARNTLRKNDLAAVAKAISLHSVDKGNLVGAGSGCGSGGSGEGWLSHKSSLGGATNYARSVIDCLRDGKYIQRDIVDPSGCTDNVIMTTCVAPKTLAYMKINCTNGSQTYAYLMARLEGGATTKPSDMSSTTCPNESWWTTYGMNYAVRAE